MPEYLVGYRQLPGSMSSDTWQMRRSHQLMLAKIKALCPALPNRLLRWSLANYDIGLAAMLVRNDSVARGLALLGRAAISDPSAVFDRLFLSPYGVRLARACLSRLIRGILAEVDSNDGRRPPFMTADPVDRGQSAPGGLMGRRLLKLACLDRKLVAAC